MWTLIGRRTLESGQLARVLIEPPQFRGDGMNRIGRTAQVVIAALVVAWALASGAAYAQTLTGSLSGTVADSSGGVLPGATVTLVNELSADTRNSVTNDQGNFVFAAVPAGTYSVKVELSGFQSIETKGIVLRLGEQRNLTALTLGVGGLSEQVAVTAMTELAPVSSGEKSATITAAQIQNIAIVGRSAAELLKVLPGMAPTQRRQQWNARVQRRGHRDQRQRRGRQAERARQLLEQRHRQQCARHRHRRRARVGPGLQLRDLGQPEPRHGRGVQGPPGELRRRERQGPDDDQRRVEGRRTRLPRHRLSLCAPLQLELERVVPEQGGQPGERRPEQAREQVLLPGLQHRRAAAHPWHRLQQEPRQAVLLLRLRVLQAGPRHRHAALVGADGGDAQRRLQRRSVPREAQWRRCQGRRPLRTAAVSCLAARSIRTGKCC